MKWASAITEATDLETAITELEADISNQLGAELPDLLFVFASPHHLGVFDQLPALMTEVFHDALVVGCSAGGVIGATREIEHKPAISVTAARLPGVRLIPFFMTSSDLQTDVDDAEAWRELVGVDPEDEPSFVLLADPLSFDATTWLQALDTHYPEAVKVGGLTSGHVSGQGALFLGRRHAASGAIGVAMTGNVTMEPITAQGCRPIGIPMFITRCRGNLLHDLDGQSAVEVLEQLQSELDDRDTELFREAVFLGVVMQQQQSYSHGDFLVRNVLGVEPRTRGLVIGTELSENQVAQFHLRDADTSHEDLDKHLSAYANQLHEHDPAGALLFSCVGRGMGLYGKVNHDTELFAHHLGPVPIGGFFGNGEIGPVNNRTWLHGYTSCFVIFTPRDLEDSVH